MKLIFVTFLIALLIVEGLAVPLETDFGVAMKNYINFIQRFGNCATEYNIQRNGNKLFKFNYISPDLE